MTFITYWYVSQLTGLCQLTDMYSVFSYLGDSYVGVLTMVQTYTEIPE